MLLYGPHFYRIDERSSIESGTGGKALIYSGRYLYRVVIRVKDILSMLDDKVTFRYQDSETKRWKT